jgi:hypothetical protein
VMIIVAEVIANITNKIAKTTSVARNNWAVTVVEGDQIKYVLVLGVVVSIPDNFKVRRYHTNNLQTCYQEQPLFTRLKIVLALWTLFKCSRVVDPLVDVVVSQGSEIRLAGNRR